MKSHKKVFLFLFCYSFAITVTAEETVARYPAESVARFVNRIVPFRQTIKHGPIEYRETSAQTSIIFAFLEDPPSAVDATGATTSHAIALLPVSAAAYEKVRIDSYDSEGGNPDIESVFFSSVDKTLDKKLIVIVSWTQNHAIVKGKLYATHVYALPANSGGREFGYLKNISERLSGGCECRHADGTLTRSRFKTAGDIKRVLDKQ